MTTFRRPFFSVRHLQVIGGVALTLLALGLDSANSVAASTATTSATLAPRNLVTQSVDTSKPFLLAGHRAAWATPTADRGALSDDTVLTNLSITLNRTAEREEAFQQLLKEQQDPSSANYHHWLTPVEIGATYGASQNDIDAVTQWLSAQGLQVDAISNSRTRITFSGSAAQIAKTFATPLHYYQVTSGQRIANTDDPQIPAALSDAVRSVRGLYTIQHTPMHHVGAAHQAIQATGSNKPAETYCSGSTCDYTVFPADFSKIYDVGSTYTGTGQTIAIIGRSRVYTTDLQNYQTLTGVSFATPTVIIPTNGADPGSPATTCSDTGTYTCSNPSDAVGEQLEITMDVERAASVAPKATIKLIVSADTTSSDGVSLGLTYAVDTTPIPANIVSVSYSSCEADNASYVTSDNQFFQQAAAEGIAIFVASGDSGAAGCESLSATPTSSQTLSINELCSSGSVTCVGGTEFADASKESTYWASSNGTNYVSALGYIPEGAWNDPLNSSSATQFSQSGGGVSNYIAKPSWQTGTGVPGSAGRYTPDVSLAASTREGYFTCMAAQGGACAPDSGGSFYFLSTGGTSASTPSMAGIAALLNQKMGSAQGNLNSRLYALAATTSNGVFHDVTVSSSAVSGCAIATPSLCNNTTPGPTGLSGGLQGYLVTTGYDEATGLGSLDVAKLLSNWGTTTTSYVDMNQHGLTGTWYDASEGGQGLVMEIYPDLISSGTGLLFAGWYTFDTTASGGQRWYTLQGNVTSTGSTASLAIGATTGGNFAAVPGVSAAQVGTATITFSTCTSGTLTYAFSDGSGRSGSIPLTRLTPNVTCTTSGDSGSAGDYLLSGGWYDTRYVGQGLVFDINPNGTLFAGWYTFKPSGASQGSAGQAWYTLQTNAFTSGTKSITDVPIIQTTGGVFDNSTSPTVVQVGTATVTFQSCSAMTINYDFTSGINAGESGTLSLVRIGSTPSGCSL